MVDRREILIPVANGKSHERRHPLTVASGNRRVGCLISEAPAHGGIRQPKSRVFDIGVGAEGYVDRREILIPAANGRPKGDPDSFQDLSGGTRSRLHQATEEQGV